MDFMLAFKMHMFPPWFLACFSYFSFVLVFAFFFFFHIFISTILFFFFHLFLLVGG